MIMPLRGPPMPRPAPPPRRPVAGDCQGCGAPLSAMVAGACAYCLRVPDPPPSVRRHMDPRALFGGGSNPTQHATTAYIQSGIMTANEARAWIEGERTEDTPSRRP